MKKKKISKIERFKKLEKELIALLVEPFEFNDDGNSEEEKRKLKNYILKVKKAGELFDEYESVAIEIEKALGDEEKDMELSSTVVDMRENKNQKVMPTREQYEREVQKEKEAKRQAEQEEYASETQEISGNVMVVRKKKRKTKSTGSMEM